VLAGLCFAALILTVIFIIVMKRKLTRRSALYADIVTAEKIIQLKITDFPDASRAFSVAVPSHKLGLQVRSFLCCGIVTITEVYRTSLENLQFTHTPKHKYAYTYFRVSTQGHRY
jgi:hypothetical protein